MKNTRIIALLAVALCLYALPTRAQSTDDTLSVQPNYKAQALADRFEHELSLDVKQKEKVFAIFLERSTQWEKQVKPVGKDHKQEHIDKINTKAQKALEKVLTAEQKARHQQLRKELQAQKEEAKREMGSMAMAAKPTDEDLEMDF
jgi:uncharacterized protein YnzC (UPF0291/DUF896 family)